MTAATTMAEIKEQRAEIQDLITLQKRAAYRDIMALFEGNKNLRTAMEEYFKQQPLKRRR